MTLGDFLSLIPGEQKFIVRIFSWSKPLSEGFGYRILKDFVYPNGYPDTFDPDFRLFLDYYVDFVFCDSYGDFLRRTENFLFILICEDSFSERGRRND